MYKATPMDNRDFQVILKWSVQEWLWMFSQTRDGVITDQISEMTGITPAVFTSVWGLIHRAILIRQMGARLPEYCIQLTEHHLWEITKAYEAKSTEKQV